MQQLALKPGERVMSIAHPGVFDDLLPYIRYEVMRAGGVDLGVVEVLREPVPESFDAAVLQKGAREARAHYKAMFRDVDAAIMMPGANTSHPAYLAMQDWLKDDLTEHRGRRTIHFHWIENGSAYPIAGQPLPSRPEMDAHYQRALLQTDYKALGRHRATVRRGAEDRRRPHHVARRHRSALPRRRSPAPTCRTATRRPRATAQGKVLVDHEIELPAGVVRVAPLEETVEGVDRVSAVAVGRPAGRGAEAALLEGARRRDHRGQRQGRGRGRDAQGRRRGPRVSRDRRSGFNPLLAVPERAPWIPYYGYGAGVVRLSLGDNTELGGAVAAAPGQPAYVRWNFFTDLTVTVGNTIWVRNGKLQ